MTFLANPRSPQQQFISLATTSSPHPWRCCKRPRWDGMTGDLQGPSHRRTTASSHGEDCLIWTVPAGVSPVRGWVDFPSPPSPPWVLLPCCPPGAIPDTPGLWGCQHHPSPQELICSLSTAFTREKKALVKFPACQAVPGEGDRLFLGNTDIKAEKKREQQQ